MKYEQDDDMNLKKSAWNDFYLNDDDDDDDDDDEDEKENDDESQEEEKSDSKKGSFALKAEKLFLKQRKIFLWSQVDDDSARYIIERLFYLSEKDPEKEITFYINSPGGLTTSGFAMLDAMSMLRNPISTVCMGMAASFGALLLACGTKGRRFAFPHAKIMIHQPLISGQIVAPAVDIKIHAEEIVKGRHEINRILSEKTGRPIHELEKDTDRDYWMTSEEAVQYGMIDGIVTKI